MDGFQRQLEITQTGFASVFDAAGEGLRESRVITGLPWAAGRQVEPFSELGNIAGTVITPCNPPAGCSQVPWHPLSHCTLISP